VYLFENGKRLSWKDPGGNKEHGFILIKDIQRITNGRETKQFKRFPHQSELQISLSFSVYTSKRSLDLEATSIMQKSEFLANLHTIMNADHKIMDIKKALTKKEFI